MSVSAADRHASVLAPPEEYLEVGFNFRMTDLQAAVGLVQLGPARRGRRAPAGDRRRRTPRRSTSSPGCGWSPTRRGAPPTSSPSGSRSAPTTGSDRDGLLAALAEADISARRGIMAAHRQPAYADRDTGRSPLPVTEHLTDNTLILPLFHQMSESEQARVIDVLRVGSADRSRRS